jgi:hypothetical protein
MMLLSTNVVMPIISDFLLFLCFQNLEKQIKAAGLEIVTVLLSEIFPDKLQLFEDVDA